MTIICGHCGLPTVPLKQIVTVNRERDVTYVSDCCESETLKNEAGEPATMDEVVSAVG